MRYTQLWKASTVAAAAFAAVMFALSLASAGESLSLFVNRVELPLVQVGEAIDDGGELEVKDRRYEGESGGFLVKLNDVHFRADEIKVTSNLKVDKGVTEHRGIIDIRSLFGQITLEYKGTASINSSTVLSKGVFEVTKATDVFDGLQASVSYEMTIVESGGTLGSPAAVTIVAPST